MPLCGQRLPALALAGCAFAGLAACSPDLGVVEANWAFVDDRLTAIYPGGEEFNSCGLPATPEGDVLYDIAIELVISDPECEGEVGDPDCDVVEPVRFPCNRDRGAVLDVPESEAGYWMVLRPVVLPDVGDEFAADPTCMTVPAARRRAVRGGLTTDLAVNEIVIRGIESIAGDIDEASLDLELCRGM